MIVAFRACLPATTPALLALTMFAGCTPLLPSAETPSALPMQADQTEQMPEAARAQPTATPDPVLVGLAARDLARVQAQALRVYANIWPVVGRRSRYVRARLLDTLKAMKAPLSLQVVPVVESGYDPYAFSHAGAMGLWQLMPGTARALGLSAGRGVNPRRHVETSTEGAVRYLLRLKARFGNWPLALAAYHRGPAAIAARLRRHPWSPEDGLNRMPVPPITRTYVQNILGLAALVRRGVLTFPEPWPVQPLHLPAPADLGLLARAANVPLAELFRFNPGLDHRQYLRSPVTLHVPETLHASLLAASAAAAPRHIHIRVRAGDNLWTLARRHHTTVAYLRRINHLSHISLHPGQTLLAPATGFNAAAPAPNPLLAQGRRIRYRVRPGDNLWTIARRFGASPAAIARANGLKPGALLHPGDRLWILARIRPS